MLKIARATTILPCLAASVLFMQSLDATILNTALPAIAKSFECSPLAMQATVIGYTLTLAILIPVSGWLADYFGTRKVFIAAVLLFTLGSACCALSNSLVELTISRIIQGVGGAVMMPVARLALLRAFPRSELLSVIKFVTTFGLIGPILGPPLGGMLVTWASWHWIFLINIPFGIFIVYFAHKYIPDFDLLKRNFDFVGFLFLSLGLTLTLFAIELPEEIKQYSWLSYVIFIFGIFMLIAYIKHANRCDSPLINLSIFKIRTFSVGILGNTISRLGTGAIPFLLPLMMQVGFNYPAHVAGSMMMPMAIGSVFGKTIVNSVLRKVRYRNSLILTTLLIGTLIICFSIPVITEKNLILLIIILFILGISTAAQFTLMNTITLGDLTDRNASSGNTLLSITQQFSMSLSVSISALILNFYNTFSHNLIDHFNLTFLTIGIITLVSVLIFKQLKSNDGNHLIDFTKKTN